MVAMDSLLAHAQTLLDDMIDLRRSIHREPEVGLDLPITRGKVLAALAGMPVEIVTHQGTSGVVAVLGGGKEGPAVLIRADMDALNMTEDTGLEFAATGSAMHACGHDLHTAMLVGALRILADRADRLAGPVVAMFQPGEEGWHGARHMIEEGVLDVAGRPARALAIHVLTPYPTGVVGLRSGPAMASADEVRIVIHGRGGHASMPHLALDPVPVACEIVLAMQTAITRRLDVFDPAVITFGHIEAGSTDNVIPEQAMLHGTMRALTPGVRAAVKDMIHRVADGVASAHGAEATVEITGGYPPTVNDPAVVEEVLALAEGIAPAAVRVQAPIMGAEDWSYVLEEVPGAMAFLGACPPDLDPATAPANHSNRVRFDESAMAVGAALYAGFALR